MKVESESEADVNLEERRYLSRSGLKYCLYLLPNVTNIGTVGSEVTDSI